MTTAEKWFLQKPLQRYGGGAPFWDSFIHEGCMVVATKNEKPITEDQPPATTPGTHKPARWKP